MSILLVRHAHAGKRNAWTGPDGQRPLSDKGQAQAEGLVAQHSGVGLDRVISSPAVRCQQTVAPLARARGLEVETADELDEGTDTETTMAFVKRLGDADVALCSHGDVLPPLLTALCAHHDLVMPHPAVFAKGATWHLATTPGTEARYLPPPG